MGGGWTVNITNFGDLAAKHAPHLNHAKNPDFTIAEARAVLDAIDIALASPTKYDAIGGDERALKRATVKLARAAEEGRKRGKAKKRGEWTAKDVAGRRYDDTTKGEPK